MHLKSRLQVAEAGAVQRQASSAEQDYEEVIQLLEAEITDLKNQLAGKRQTRGVEATKARLELSTLTCSPPRLTLTRKHHLLPHCMGLGL